MTEHAEDRQIEILTGAYLVLDVPEEKVVELDLGCGSGSFTAALAQKYPERQIFAADVMIGRLRKLVKRCNRTGICNMRLLRVEARMLVGRMFPDRALDRIHLLCPDPWPKGRHRGHRLLASDFTSQLHRVLKENGVFHFSSDDRAYCEAVAATMAASGIFQQVPGDAELADVKSDFELRWLEEGKTVEHQWWKKMPLPPAGPGH